MAPHREPYNGEERRAQPTQPDGFLEGVPVWARAIAVVGIPGAIALYLVWIGSNTVPAMSQEIAIVHQEVLNLRKALEDGIRQQENLYRLEQLICSNSSKTDEERNRCFDR